MNLVRSFSWALYNRLLSLIGFALGLAVAGAGAWYGAMPAYEAYMSGAPIESLTTDATRRRSKKSTPSGAWTSVTTECSFGCGREATRLLGLPHAAGSWAAACDPCYGGLKAQAEAGGVIDFADLDEFADRFVDPNQEEQS